jgi:3-oxoacyl-[acyl-carrier protein] reductase
MAISSVPDSVSESVPESGSSRPLDGRVAIVTGGNHGIGAATSCRLAALGADVLVTYLRNTNPVTGDVPAAYAEQRAADGDHVVAAVEALGRRAIAVEADLADPDTIPMLFDTAEAALGPVDIVINNASGWIGDTFRPVDVDELGREMAPISAATVDPIMAVDARAAALMIGELGRRLAQRRGNWGRVVGLTSGGSSGFPNEVTYGAAKAAQVNYTMSAATELAPLGVTANIVHPPVTDTGWVNDGVREFVARSAGHTHVATPDEVAEVIGWLCTDQARLVSGTVMQLR